MLKKINTVIGLVRTLFMFLFVLLDNIFVCFGNNVFPQIVGIPMGMNCAPLIALFGLGWKRIRADFLFCFCLSMNYHKKSSYQEGRVGILLSGLTLPIFLCLSQARTCISDIICRGMFCV